MKHIQAILFCQIIAVISLCQTEETFHCTAKPGCQIANCDPVASDWNQSEYDIRKYLLRKEFPIICKQMVTRDSSTLLQLVYNNIKENEYLKVKVEQMEQRIDSLTATNNILTTSIERLEKTHSEMQKKICFDKSGIIVESMCYWSEVHSTRNTDLEEAREICVAQGFKLADVFTMYQYDIIMTYLRRQMPAKSLRFHIWTGMKKDKIGNAILSNGKIATYKKVRTIPSVWAMAGSQRTRVYILVHKNSEDSDQGLGAMSWSEETFGALCSFYILSSVPRLS
uniref:uncharacterized protein LOC120337716 isoform X1 n=1 Tax=Styela clava TaxID=7725 RepID=UPI0019392888|nr:uncharacterized protein LOC120337716 isoform X1 [Styela clava]